MRQSSIWTTSGKKLHLGCGSNIVDGWINLDGSWNARLAKCPIIKRVLCMLHIIPESQQHIEWNRQVLIHNVTRPLPFTKGSVRCIYSSHLLEHLYFEDARQLLRECYRVLQTGGVLRVVVPDLKSCVLEYLGQGSFKWAEERVAMCSAERLNRRLRFRSTGRPEGNIFYRLYSALTDFHSHKWMYDAEALKRYFVEAGFENVEERRLFDSRIEGIREIESPERIENGAGICVEGIKQ